MSDMNFQDDDAKELSRLHNICQVKRCPNLYNSHTDCLRCDWLELAGDTAETLRLLRSMGLLKDTRFLGVDYNEEAIQQCVEKFGASSTTHEFFCDTLLSVFRGSRAENVGVCNWDSTLLGTGDKFRSELEGMWEFSKRQEKRFGSFVLIINAGLDRGATLESFRSSVLEVTGHELDEEHLKLPGVLYGGSSEGRKGRRSTRINYPIILGHTKPERKQEDG